MEILKDYVKVSNIQLEYNKIIQQEKEINPLVCEYNSIIHKQLYPDCLPDYGPADGIYTKLKMILIIG